MGDIARSLLAGVAERASLQWVGELELGAELVEGVRASVCLVEGRTPRLVETYGGVYSHQPDLIVVKTSLTKAVLGDVERCGAVVDGVVRRLGELSPQRGYQTCLDVIAGRSRGLSSETGNGRRRLRGWSWPTCIAVTNRKRPSLCISTSAKTWKTGLSSASIPGTCLIRWGTSLLPTGMARRRLLQRWRCGRWGFRSRGVGLIRGWVFCVCGGRWGAQCRS